MGFNKSLIILIVSSYIKDILTMPPSSKNQYNNINILLQGPCRNHQIEKNIYKKINKDIKNLSGIIIRTDCNPIEIILWFKSTNDVFWVNPFIALRGLADDIMKINTPKGLKTKFFDIIDRLFYPSQLSPEAPILPPPPLGCISQKTGLTETTSCL
ncbi:envelope glycoprotein L [Canid alphaherpesvirus 1]|uniref:Envelope glycoprotein L n=1 Tax=Canid alphaherpesvirus 1 TaxID=170325 RepID=A0A172DSW9_9ALPH|nr:envelope glycoprotein L [Canid alphaherpesvirus 1]ALL25935.1 envelope glycoprotein L [Canid alphaherpesvirus 1]ALL26016.1 envelope glycoprotein L [Canid alphaherpesvirus 1]ALL26091.1 envelope glycoprotein L [Canid alphaherpesvirus 1]AQX83373.1 envelope glycoprotein L [Canid alphaherpesvirus 1]ARE29862.1 envelope glycoprotein L [Canid alphaherpesvirus 1]